MPNRPSFRVLLPFCAALSHRKNTSGPPPLITSDGVIKIKFVKLLDDRAAEKVTFIEHQFYVTFSRDRESNPGQFAKA
jgi:hypothetical protein